MKISAFRYGRLVSRNMDNVAVRLRAEGIKFPDETIIDYYFFLGDAQLTKHLNLSKPVIYYADATFDFDVRLLFRHAIKKFEASG